MMRQSWMLLLLMLLLLPLHVHGRKPISKLSPWLRETVKSHPTLLHRAGEEEEDFLTVVLAQLAPSVTDEQLATYQAKRFAQLDDIAILMLPLRQVEALSELETVQRMEANQWAQTTMDTVPKVVDLLSVYQQTDQHQAYTGKGVVVGVMDVGFDLTHPTFSTNGQYRIGAYWDQLAPQETDSPLPVGRDYVTPESILSKAYATDGKSQNHGTHTAGIAAGSGHDTNFRGVAFESDICLVSNAVTADTVFIPKADFYKYTSATDALGFKYLFDYAERQHKPCVVSFSEGYTPYIDQDDSLFSAFLGKLQGPGRILVASAGNECVAQTYVAKPKGMAEAGAFLNCSRKSARYQMKTTESLELHLIIYNSTTHEIQQDKVLSMKGLAEDEHLEDILLIDEQECSLTMYRYPSTANPNDTIYQLQLSAPVELNKLADIALVAVGEESLVEIYGSSSNALKNMPDVDARWNAATSGHNVLAPGCFASAICVGATAHRPGYVNADGKYQKSGNVTTPGLRAYYSSFGPALNGLNKPDITAPGTNVLSSYSSYYFEEHPTSTSSYVAYSEVDGRQYPWGVNSGTSMATPVVAGTVALWLEANPSLTPDDVLAIFSRTSKHTDASLDYPNDQYGYGEIDAYRGLLDILQLTDIATISQHHPEQVQIGMKDGQLFLRFADVPRYPVTVSIYSTGGILVSQTVLTSLQTETTMPLTQLASGIYAVQLTSAEPAFTGSALIRR